MRLRLTLVAAPILTLLFVAAAFAKSDGGVAQESAQAAAITCGSTRTIGMAAPITGPAASIGTQQLRWAQFFVNNWNKLKANKNRKIKLIQGDTQLGVNTSFAVSVAQSFASNSKVLAVVGPAGSQEVVASTSAYKSGGLGFVSGSATRVSLADGVTDGNRVGYFYRTVPNDAIQAPTVANYIIKKLNATRVYIIDDQETYSQGLADGVQALLRAKGVTVTRDSISQQASDFSSNIAKIPGNTQVVYIPWQLAPAGPDLRAAAQGGRQGRHHDVRIGRPVRPGHVEDHRFVRLVLPGRHLGRGRQGVSERAQRRRRVLRSSQLRRSPGRSPGGHEGVRRRQGHPRRRCVRRWPGSTFPRRSHSWESVSTSRRTATSATAGSGSTRSKATERTSGSASASVRLRRDGVRPTQVGRTLYRTAPARTACDSVTSRMRT